MLPLLRSLGIVALLGLVAPAFGEMVDNPAYQAWAKYKAGTYVVYDQQSEMPMPPNAPPGMSGGMKAQMTQTLEKITPDAAVVTVTTSAGGHEMKEQMQVPAKVDKDEMYIPPQDPGRPKVIVKNQKEGTDAVDVNGKSIDAKTHEMDVEQPGSRMSGHVKVWFSDTVPGGMVKMEATTKIPQGDVKMHMTLKDFKVQQ